MKTMMFLSAALCGALFLSTGCPIVDGPNPNEGEGEGEGEQPGERILSMLFPIPIATVAHNDEIWDCGGALEHEEIVPEDGVQTTKPTPTDGNSACATRDIDIQGPGEYLGDWTDEGGCGWFKNGAYEDPDGSGLVVQITTTDEGGFILLHGDFLLPDADSLLLKISGGEFHGESDANYDEASGFHTSSSGTISDCELTYHEERDGAIRIDNAVLISQDPACQN